VESGAAAGGEEFQDVSILRSTGGHDAEHPLDESAARLAVGSAAASAPKHHMTQHPLGVVVRRLDPLDPDEGPQGGFLLQQFAASDDRLFARALCATLQLLTHRVTQGADVLLKR